MSFSCRHVNLDRSFHKPRMLAMTADRTTNSTRYTHQVEVQRRWRATSKAAHFYIPSRDAGYPTDHLGTHT